MEKENEMCFTSCNANGCMAKRVLLAAGHRFDTLILFYKLYIHQHLLASYVVRDGNIRLPYILYYNNIVFYQPSSKMVAVWIDVFQLT
jgi:hypothetical protein